MFNRYEETLIDGLLFDLIIMVPFILNDDDATWHLIEATIASLDCIIVSPS